MRSFERVVQQRNISVGRYVWLVERMCGFRKEHVWLEEGIPGQEQTYFHILINKLQPSHSPSRHNSQQQASLTQYPNQQQLI